MCGHTFFATRRGALSRKSDVARRDGLTTKAASRSPPLSEDKGDDLLAGSSKGPLIPDDFDLPPRRTGRVQREKPNFYDALEYETQMRKVKFYS
jgi:hypothetical protein